jgi:SAM-dependent methyltransferase
VNNTRFQTGDATNLADLADGQFDLSTFTDAAHHMPDTATVSQVLSEMERVTSPDGLVVVMDLVRLRTAKLTKRYVNLLGSDYVERGLPQFFDDFYNSMFAAWTVDELKSTVPRDSKRSWFQLVPRGLPTVQFILGVEGDHPFHRKGLPWKVDDSPLARDLVNEWRMARTSLQFANPKRIRTA